MKQKKSKQKLSLWLIGILFFIGVASILYPSVSNLISLMTSSTTIAEYQEDVKNMTSEDLSSLFERANKFNTALFNNTVDKENAKCLNRNGGVMCYLDIPCINVYLPVYYGTSSEVLEKGCGYIENTSLPVGGKNTHSAISGHTGLPSAEMLTNLDRTKLGDVFYIHVLGEVLAYQVDDIHSVMPYETDALRIVKGEDYVTLLTCTPYGINDRRLLVRGKRIPYNPQTTEQEIPILDPPKNEGTVDWNIINQIVIIAVIALIALSVFIAAVINVHIFQKKIKRNAESLEHKSDVSEDKDG